MFDLCRLDQTLPRTDAIRNLRSWSMAWSRLKVSAELKLFLVWATTVMASRTTHNPFLCLRWYLGCYAFVLRICAGKECLLFLYGYLCVYVSASIFVCVCPLVLVSQWSKSCGLVFPLRTVSYPSLYHLAIAHFSSIECICRLYFLSFWLERMPTLGGDGQQISESSLFINVLLRRLYERKRLSLALFVIVSKYREAVDEWQWGISHFGFCLFFFGQKLLSPIP